MLQLIFCPKTNKNSRRARARARARGEGASFFLINIVELNIRPEEAIFRPLGGFFFWRVWAANVFVGDSRRAKA